MAKYLVVGGAGFIGTNLVKQLKAEGHEPVVFDNFSGGRFENRIQPGVRYVEGDITRIEDLHAVCSEGFDGIFLLAAMVRVTVSVEKPAETHNANINGTLNVLLAARDAHIKRVVFSSSSSVYGNQTTFPLREDMVGKPLSPYALHKHVGEEYCRLFNELYGLETVCLRYFNVYGPYFDPAGHYALVIGKFLRLRKEGKPMTVCGDGEYYRDFTYVSDVVRANILAMQNTEVGKADVFNIGGGSPHSINELVKLIGGEAEYVPERPGDIRYSAADTGKAKRVLGWEPQVSLEEGIAVLKKDWGIS